jgi:peptidoglycan-N-acetylglucosamine deacetylase
MMIKFFPPCALSMFVLMACAGHTPVPAIKATLILKQPIPDRVVVLTFDDAIATHATVVAPLLKKYNFNATFYVCEFPPDFQDKNKYLSWRQIRALSDMGFEIGNHGRTHQGVSKMTPAQFLEELVYIETQCKEFNHPVLSTYAYAGYDTAAYVFPILREKGYTFARIGGQRPYDPQKDHPFLVPSFSTSGTDSVAVFSALRSSHDGKIVVLTVHGVPDTVHPWVNTPVELFTRYLEFLKTNNYKVIAMRDLAQYIDAQCADRLLPLSSR